MPQVLDPWELAANEIDPDFDPFDATPGVLAQRLDPVNTVQTPALDLIDNALLDVANGRCERLILSMPPQEGKSQRLARRFPSWLLIRNPDLRIAIASYEYRTARRWGRIVRDDLVGRGLIELDPGVQAADEWKIARREGGVYSVGVGGALTGRPVDTLIIDDPIKDRQQAESESYREQVWNWWTDVAVPRLAPGAPVVLDLTRWHEDDLAGRLIAEEGGRWRVINIPAQADHNPAKGEKDPLGRRPGEWLVSTRGRTPKDWEAKRREVGTRTFTALYQGRPSPELGTVFQRTWWGKYHAPLWQIASDGTCHVPDGGEIIQSWDMTFKDTKASDFVVGQVWLRRGVEVFLLDQVRDRMTFTKTVQAVRRLTKTWPQARLKLVEDKANGAAVIDSLRSEIGGIVPISPKESKFARASAISPFVEAGNVHLPTRECTRFDVEGFVEECAAFDNGTHDDQVDALSQALERLLLKPGQGQAFLEYWRRGGAQKAEKTPTNVVPLRRRPCKHFYGIPDPVTHLRVCRHCGEPPGPSGGTNADGRSDPLERTSAEAPATAAGRA